MNKSLMNALALSVQLFSTTSTLVKGCGPLFSFHPCPLAVINTVLFLKLCYLLLKKQINKSAELQDVRSRKKVFKI